MASNAKPAEFSEEERRSDSRADAISAVLLVCIAVVVAVFWVSGH